MNTLSALTLIFIQLAIVLAAMYYNRVDYVDSLAVYGSPIYLILNIGEITPDYYTKHLNGMFILSFHTFKYFFLIRAFTIDSPSIQRILAVLMEVAYLTISYYCILSL